MLRRSAFTTTFALTSLLAVATYVTPAVAGECPSDQVGANPLADRMTAPAGVTDTVLGSINLAGEPVSIDGRLFRLRRLEIQPGGVVPFHSQEDRPAQIYVV